MNLEDNAHWTRQKIRSWVIQGYSVSWGPPAISYLRDLWTFARLWGEHGSHWRACVTSFWLVLGFCLREESCLWGGWFSSISTLNFGMDQMNYGRKHGSSVLNFHFHKVAPHFWYAHPLFLKIFEVYEDLCQKRSQKQHIYFSYLFSGATMPG